MQVPAKRNAGCIIGFETLSVSFHIGLHGGADVRTDGRTGGRTDGRK